MPKASVLSLDCGTTGNRAVVFDQRQRVLAEAYREFKQYYPKPGWVEHDPEEIWDSARHVLGSVLKKISPKAVKSIGITNQRETVVLWDRRTGKPVSRAIVWQCSRTSGICQSLRAKGWEAKIHRKTGLFLDPYFSASKILWLTRQYPRIRRGLAGGRIVCGTIDAWVIWKLTGGESFSTDPTNASRTMLYDIRNGRWDGELCALFGVPVRALPEVLPSCGVRAWTLSGITGRRIPIAGVAGDQQSAAFAQGCSQAGVVKNTYGTGLFVVAETGRDLKYSKRLVSTVAASAVNKPLRYALEGSIFIGGAAVQWLRDGLRIVKDAASTEARAKALPSNQGVYFVPALAGLGCPHWDPAARGLVIGLTRQTSQDHLIRAALEAMAYQTRDVIDRVAEQTGKKIKRLRVDGGAVKNNFLMQFQSDILGCRVERPLISETTALGAAGLAGIAVGIWKDTEHFLGYRGVDRVFAPKMPEDTRKKLYADWQRAVRRSLAWEV